MLCLQESEPAVGYSQDIEQKFLDELITSPLYKRDEFEEVNKCEICEVAMFVVLLRLQLLRHKKEERGSTMLEKRYWGHPRYIGTYQE